MDTFTPEHCSALQAASLLGIEVNTLRVWRRRGSGPPARRFGRLYRYHTQTLREWAERQTGQ
jgi:DNA-binding transcriptional MerR regulator